MSTGNPRIAPTAYFTAEMWAHAGFPDAGRFSTPRGRFLLSGFRALSVVAGWALPPAVRKLEDSLCIRHACFDAWIAEKSPDFTLELGAGLSARGLHACGRNPDITWIDVDLPHMVAAKQALLGPLRLPERYHIVAGDLLSGDLSAGLPAQPTPGQRVVAMTEGVTDYLSREERGIAWRGIADLLRRFGGGSYLVDIYPAERLRAWPKGTSAAMGILGKVSGTPLEERVFERTAEAEVMLRDSGFDSVERLDVERYNTSRWRLPEDVRLFDLVEARIA